MHPTPGYLSGPGVGFRDPDTGDWGPRWGWLTVLLPGVEQGNLYNSLNINLVCWDAANTTSVQFARWSTSVHRRTIPL